MSAHRISRAVAVRWHSMATAVIIAATGYGLLCTRSGLPVAVEVFEGNAADPSTLSAQVSKLKRRFGLSRVVWSVTAG
jgi:hypothetical protein